MLLQLMEPGTTPLPHDQEPIDLPKIAVGIDLGTTNSLVAFAEGQQARILKINLAKSDHQELSDSQFHNGILPSVVHYSIDGTITVGHKALAALDYDADNVIVSVKRSISHQASTHSRTSQMATFNTVQGSKNSVEVSADILKALKSHAENVLGVAVDHAVITVPAYFDESARTLTRDAARLAGLDVLRMINEPTAAALAYGLDKGVEGIYAVYDLGGGTFDFSILRLQKGVFQVLATGGDTHLGGDDFDVCLLKLITDEYLDTNIDQLNRHYKNALQVVRTVKERLSQSPIIDESITLFDQVITINVTATAFAQSIKPLIDRTLSICHQVIQDAKINQDDLQGVIMVGGATRTPSVTQAVQDYFSCTVLCDINPDQAVAIGASLQANALTHGSDMLLLDVNPLSLGLETMGGLVEKIIPRNSSIPLVQTQEFTTFEDGQTAILIHVVQGERELVKDCSSLARFEIHGIPALPAGIARIQITFALDADGLLTVSALEKTTGMSQKIEVKPTYGLTIDQMNQMLMASFKHAQQDIDARALQTALIQSQQLLKVLEPALIAERELIDDQEYHLIVKTIDQLKQACTQQNHQHIKEAVVDLESASKSFIQKRIDHALKMVVRGQRIADF